MQFMSQPFIAGPGQGAAARAERARVRWALAGLSLSMLLSSLGISSANVALPTLVQAFNASFQHVQWIVLAYLLAITTLIVGAGRLGDIIGRRRLLLAGLILFTLASALCALAPTLGLLIAARAAQGAGAAVMMALTMAFVGETVPKEKTGSAMGLLGTMSAIGTALGPSLGGFLIAGPHVSSYKIRGVIFIIGSILAFAATIRPLGLVIASFCTMIICAAAAEDVKWRETLIVAIVVTTFCSILFPYGLNLPFQLWPRFW